MILPLKKSVVQVFILAVTCVMLPAGNCQIVEADMPQELIECAQLLSNNTGDLNMAYDTSEDIFVHCLQQFLWKEENVQWNEFNITEKDKGFVNSLLKSFVRRGRSKRTPGPSIFPTTGFRIRREYRRISDRERADLHSAFNRMKLTGQYDTFANMHRGIVEFSAHRGPNFLGWHRVYLALLEEALRQIYPMMSLPYWDSTLDAEMAIPVNSIIWTEPFLGNGNGHVTIGPFAHWMAAGRPLTRNIGRGSELFKKENISRILTRCRVRDITPPTAMEVFDLDFIHGGPHVWVGGQFSAPQTAAHDPVFFLHHAYIDYVWEMFRIRQATFCGVNPSTDYPPTAGLHAAERPMDQFPQYRNIDGYRDYWTRFWYRYERTPTCSTWQPFCGSPYLRCDISRQRCVSMARMRSAPLGVGFGGEGMAYAEPTSIESERQARLQESELNLGELFRAPPPGPMTQDARLVNGMFIGRKKRAVNQVVEKKPRLQENDTKYSTLGPVFQAPPLVGHTSDFQNGAFVGGVISVHRGFTESAITEGSEFPVSDSIQLLPTPNYHDTSLNSILKPPIRNTFIINGHEDISQWVFIPVKVIYKSDRGKPVSSFLQSESQYPEYFRNRSSSNSQYTVQGAKKCVQDESGAMQVRIQSSGLNYNGHFSNYALIDSNLPVDSATAYIGIKSPDVESTVVILSAVHSCGLMCQAYCYVPDSAQSFRPCAGVLKISNKDKNLYSRTYEEAVSRMWQGTVSGAGAQNQNLRVVFDCPNTDMFP